MRKLILIVLGVLVTIVVVFVVVVAMQRADFSVERSTTIAAPPEDVFAHVNDLHKWEDWSPWAKVDPDCKQTFEGSAGKGASFAWDGNDKVGKGKMTIIESHPNDLIRIEIHFDRPFEGTNIAEFTFKPEGKQTLVMWSMSGQKGFVTKAVCMFMDMDKMLGGEFEKGLANLKSVVEAENKK